MRLMAVEKSTDEENFDKMKAAYDACLDEDMIKKAGAAPLTELLDEIKQAYPANALGRSDSHDLKNAILLLAKYGVSVLVSSGTGADDTDPDKVVISVSPPWSFGLPSKERYEDHKLFEKYRDVTLNVLYGLYPNEDWTKFGEIADLEQRLAAASPSTEEREDVTKYYNPMLIEEAAAIAPEIELDELLHGLAPSHSKIERVIVTSPKYLKDLSVILAATDRKVIQSYFVWRTVQSFSSYIDADAVKPYKRFKNELAGKVSGFLFPI
jgi:endothelin-converting enzyme